jgi:hypothetical protein
MATPIFAANARKKKLEQVTFFNRLRREYPDTYGLIALHPRNEQQLRGSQHRTMITQKAEGMTPGAADIIIPGSPAFVCEMKRQDHTLSTWKPGQEEIPRGSAGGRCLCLRRIWL